LSENYIPTNVRERERESEKERNLQAKDANVLEAGVSSTHSGAPPKANVPNAAANLS
jgi:hypothetical protein